MISILPQQTSRVTLELREIVENGVDIWAFEYPSFYTGAEKKAFEQKVIDHFYFRQIGQETVGRFLHVFRRTVREIMPVKIKRYESIKMMDAIENPLDNYAMIEEYEEDRNETRTGSHEDSSTGTSSTDSSTTGSGEITHNEKKDTTHADKDTPQNTLAWTVNNNGNLEIDHASNVFQEQTETANSETSSASETGNVTGESSQTSNGTSQESSEGGTTHKLTRRGNIGVTTYAQMLEGYRASFIDVDLEIIDELETCFLGVF